MKAIDRIGSAFLRHQEVNFSFRTAAKLANALRMDFCSMGIEARCI